MMAHVNLAGSAPAVLQLLPKLRDDAVTHTAIAIAHELVEDGWRAVIASSGGPLEPLVTASGALHVELPLEASNPVTVWSTISRLAKLARQRKVALIHAHSPGTAWSGSSAARKIEAAFVTSFHRFLGDDERRLNKRFNSIMAAGDRVITVSDFLADHLTGTYGIDAGKIRTVHRGVDLATFDPDIVRGHRLQTLGEKWQIGLDRKTVLLPGTIEASRGHALMLQAMARMKQDECLLLIVGGYDPASAYVKQIEVAVADHGLGERVRFTGHCDDMPAAYALADAVVLPATDGLPVGRSIVEAQAMGKPVVVTNVGGLEETVLPASTGWLVPVDNPDELAWAVDLALSLDDDVKERVAERGRDFVTTEFGKEQMARRTVAVYRELVHHAPRPRTTEAQPRPEVPSIS